MHIQIEFYFFLFVILKKTFKNWSTQIDPVWFSEGATIWNQFESFPYLPHHRDRIEGHKIFPYSAAWSTSHKLHDRLLGFNRDTITHIKYAKNLMVYELCHIVFVYPGTEAFMIGCNFVDITTQIYWIYRNFWKISNERGFSRSLRNVM